MLVKMLWKANTDYMKYAFVITLFWRRLCCTCAISSNYLIINERFVEIIIAAQRWFIYQFVTFRLRLSMEDNMSTRYWLTRYYIKCKRVFRIGANISFYYGHIRFGTVDLKWAFSQQKLIRDMLNTTFLFSGLNVSLAATKA